jgi:hypothetical protein
VATSQREDGDQFIKTIARIDESIIVASLIPGEGHTSEVLCVSLTSPVGAPMSLVGDPASILMVGSADGVAEGTSEGFMVLGLVPLGELGLVPAGTRGSTVGRAEGRGEEVGTAEGESLGAAVGETNSGPTSSSERTPNILSQERASAMKL